jgi:hypothetical protein
MIKKLRNHPCSKYGSKRKKKKTFFTSIDENLVGTRNLTQFTAVFS